MITRRKKPSAYLNGGPGKQVEAPIPPYALRSIPDYVPDWDDCTPEELEAITRELEEGIEQDSRQA